eukprot:1144729-Pelagomonas_calceolata.AAC.2
MNENQVPSLRQTRKAWAKAPRTGKGREGKGRIRSLYLPTRLAQLKGSWTKACTRVTFKAPDARFAAMWSRGSDGRWQL